MCFKLIIQFFLLYILLKIPNKIMSLRGEVHDGGGVRWCLTHTLPWAHWNIYPGIKQLHLRDMWWMIKNFWTTKKKDCIEKSGILQDIFRICRNSSGLQPPVSAIVYVPSTLIVEMGLPSGCFDLPVRLPQCIPSYTASSPFQLRIMRARRINRASANIPGLSVWTWYRPAD